MLIFSYQLRAYCLDQTLVDVILVHELLQNKSNADSPSCIFDWNQSNFKSQQIDFSENFNN